MPGGEGGDSHNRSAHGKVCGKVFVLRTSTVFGPESRDGKNTIYQLCRSLSKVCTDSLCRGRAAKERGDENVYVVIVVVVVVVAAAAAVA